MPAWRPRCWPRLVDPRVQDALCTRDRVRLVRIDRVLSVEYALHTAQDDPYEAGRYVLRLAETLMRSPVLPLGPAPGSPARW